MRGLAPAIERRLFDRLVVNGVGCCETQLLVSKWPFLQVKEQKAVPSVGISQVWNFPTYFLGKLLASVYAILSIRSTSPARRE